MPFKKRSEDPDYFLAKLKGDTKNLDIVTNIVYGQSEKTTVEVPISSVSPEGLASLLCEIYAKFDRLEGK